jgi:hypothetical protein
MNGIILLIKLQVRKLLKNKENVAGKGARSDMERICS